MDITDIHEHIIQTHILTRLDGPTLAATGCASSRLQSLCSDDKLWSDICSSNWPSTEHPLVNQTILNFTSGHRSFFSDAFPSPSHHLITTTTSFPPTSHIINSVDLRYDDSLLFSKVEPTDTTPSKWFESTPFRVDLLGPKDVVQPALKLSGDDYVMQWKLERHMTLSWIIIDPTRNRAVNVSSLKPVFVQRNWLTDEIELTFALVTARDDGHVSCNVEVTCGVKGGSSELCVSGVSLTLRDVDGKCLNGKDSLVILQGLTAAERRRNRGGDGWKEKYDEYIERRKERKERMERRERGLDLVRVACVMAFWMAFWSLALY
ncbi:hypothetical protein L1987_00962 [Smallanthus sonchifolius]|uniref:Uncharacterized protein n=1 Tax=Smallanthus sonchifolius TaxID=185202 RepID=A0ACB9K3T2_9ASTR|nr:hypothetical protein L1987_00962 [Smallanthus sonchifolius]